MLSKYNEFLLEKLVDAINESIIYYSPPFRKILKKVKSDISKDLIELENKDVKDDITFIDLDQQIGYISFTTEKNARKSLSIKYDPDKYPHIYNMFDKPFDGMSDTLFDINNDIWTKSRNPLKLGRFINKVLPGKYSAKQIEEFTNKFKAVLDGSSEKFILVSGNDIAYWYDSGNYYSQESTLGSSCMRDEGAKTFEIYTNNPEVCQMLCLVDEIEDDSGEPATKLKARAIVWKVTKTKGTDHVGRSDETPFEFFMDRQYTIHDSLVEKMKNYAKEKGWGYKTNNNHHSFSSVTVGDNNIQAKMEVKVKPIDGKNDFKYERYPYMDTFRRYDPNTGVLYNDNDEDTINSGQYLLEDTDGGFDEINAAKNYSEWYDRYLSEDDAIWSDPLEDYLPQDEAVLVEVGSRNRRGWYPTEYDDIVYDEFKERYMHVNDAVFSDSYGYYILADESISIVSSINQSTGDCNREDYYIHEEDTSGYVSYSDVDHMVWFKSISSKDYWDRHSGIKKSLLCRNWDSDWIILQFKIEVYKLANPVGKLEYMTEMDAKLLELDIDTMDNRDTDSWTYTEELSSVKIWDKLFGILSDKIDSKQLEIDFGPEFKRSGDVEKYKKRLSQLENFLR